MSRSVAGLERAPPAEVEDRLEHPVGVGPHRLETLVGPVEEPLLFLAFGVCGHVVPSSAA